MNISLETLPYVEFVEVSVATDFLTKLRQRKNSIAYSVTMASATCYYVLNFTIQALDVIARCVVFGSRVLTETSIETNGINIGE